MSLYGVIGYHVTSHVTALVPHLVATLIYLSQNYSYYIRGDRSPLISFSTELEQLHDFGANHRVFRYARDIVVWPEDTLDIAL